MIEFDLDSQLTNNNFDEIPINSSSTTILDWY